VPPLRYGDALAEEKMQKMDGQVAAVMAAGAATGPIAGCRSPREIAGNYCNAVLSRVFDIEHTG
jgi:hypothetical protein